MRRRLAGKGVAVGILVMSAVGAMVYGLHHAGLLDALWERERLHAALDRLGMWGPLALIALEMAAIIFSPIPSGPIALAAGAIYGPVWGTVYIVIGAVAGALIAFTIARCLGYEAVRRWSSTRQLMAYFEPKRSQLWLMGVVFASRLVPFISFDAVSYAAGLTPIAFWRFAVATVAGVVPISAALTYAGEELAGLNPRMVWIVLALLALMTAIPIAVQAVRTFRSRSGSG